MPSNKLAIIILNWNGVDYTTASVAALLADPTCLADIYILDNGSTTDEAVILRERFGEKISVERLDKNLGFTGGNNYVMRQLLPRQQYDYIVLLNQDTVIAPGCMHTLTEYMNQAAKVAVCGPLVIDTTTQTVQSCGATIQRWTGKIISRQQGQPPTTIPVVPAEVDCVIGNCFMMRVAAIEQIGLLDNGYFAYYEEADWCVRAQQHGWQCAVVPQAVIQHAKAGGFKTYFITRNMIWFQKEHASLTQLIFFWGYFWLYYVPERIKKGSRWKDVWRGAHDGWWQTKPKAI